MRCPTKVPVGSPGVTLSGLKVVLPSVGGGVGLRAGASEDWRAGAGRTVAVCVGRLVLSSDPGKMASETVEQPIRTSALPTSTTENFFIDNTVGGGKTLARNPNSSAALPSCAAAGPQTYPFVGRSSPERINPVAILTKGSTGDKAHLLGMTWIYWPIRGCYFVFPSYGKPVPCLRGQAGLSSVRFPQGPRWPARRAL